MKVNYSSYCDSFSVSACHDGSNKLDRRLVSASSSFTAAANSVEMWIYSLQLWVVSQAAGAIIFDVLFILTWGGSTTHSAALYNLTHFYRTQTNAYFKDYIRVPNSQVKKIPNFVDFFQVSFFLKEKYKKLKNSWDQNLPYFSVFGVTSWMTPTLTLK